MTPKVLATALTILAGTHNAAVELVQFYNDQSPRHAPRFSRPYDYDRDYGPGRDSPDVYHPAERDWNNAMRRFRFERDWRERTYPSRPY